MLNCMKNTALRDGPGRAGPGGEVARAIQIERHCGPEDLRLVEVPTRSPGPGEVLIRVRAAAVQFASITAGLAITANEFTVI